MEVYPYAGKLAEPAMLVNVPKFIMAYYTNEHLGSTFNKAFNEWNLLTISQAICLYCNLQKMMAVARGMHSFRKKSQYSITGR